MQKINSESDLNLAIQFLRNKQTEEGEMLREQIQNSIESIKPINLIKNAFKQVTESPEIKKENIVNTAVGLAAGYLSKRLFERISNNPYKKILGTALLFGITNVVAKKPELVKSLGQVIFKILRNRLGPKRVEIGSEANESEN